MGFYSVWGFVMTPLVADNTSIAHTKKGKHFMACIVFFLFYSRPLLAFQRMAQSVLFCCQVEEETRSSRSTPPRVIHLHVIKKLLVAESSQAAQVLPKIPRRRVRRVVNKNAGYISNAINRGQLKTLHDCRHLIV